MAVVQLSWGGDCLVQGSWVHAGMNALSKRDRALTSGAEMLCDLIAVQAVQTLQNKGDHLPDED